MGRETEVLVAARGDRLGPREWLEVVAIIRRPGRYDARYREMRVGSVRVPDERTERGALEAHESIARSLGGSLVVRPGRA